MAESFLLMDEITWAKVIAGRCGFEGGRHGLSIALPLLPSLAGQSVR